MKQVQSAGRRLSDSIRQALLEVSQFVALVQTHMAITDTGRRQLVLAPARVPVRNPHQSVASRSRF